MDGRNKTKTNYTKYWCRCLPGHWLFNFSFLLLFYVDLVSEWDYPRFFFVLGHGEWTGRGGEGVGKGKEG
jgi:hypothetical protein